MNLRSGLDKLKAMSGIHTDKEIANKLGIQLQALTQRIRRKQVSLEKIEQIAAACGRTTDELLALSLDLNQINGAILAYLVAESIEHLHNRRILEP